MPKSTNQDWFSRAERLLFLVFKAGALLLLALALIKFYWHELKAAVQFFLN